MVTAALVLAVGLLAAQEPPAPAASPSPAPLRAEDHDTAFSIYTDQDVFWPPSEDKDYTMGVQFSFAGAWVAERRFDAPLRFFDRLFRVDGFHGRLQQDGIRGHSFSFGNSGFTPRKGEDGEILARTEPLYDDRPYANILFAAVRRQTFRYHTAITSELTVGLLGLRVGRAVQTWIHSQNGDVRPGGWHHQISNGGEPTLRYGVTLQQVMFRRYLGVEEKSDQEACTNEATRADCVRLRHRFETTALGGGEPGRVRWVDFVGDLQGNVGYYTNLGAGLKLRLGRIMSSPYGDRLPINTTKAVPQPGRQAERPWELFVWGGLGGTAWGYNALLQGQFRDSHVRLGFSPRQPSTTRLNRFTGDWQTGITGSVKWFSATYAPFSGHSPLFDGPTSRTHSWGGAYLVFAR